ncbi:hypothetical protein J9B83_08650 [Marinomonas sp. A79]|uniref:Uncharacterized protein n=1 Tax=Marinomonas vulgaris TaxID=2823372 RepID=A0ABS5HBH9_9GAMM|nr:hypothetical protein [Marinomonas vulgaris]MBR7889017.1 hypothetical protein [Marinomonas vulgaris]
MLTVCFLLLFLLCSTKPLASVYLVHDTEESSARALSFQLSRLLTVDSDVIPVRRAVFLTRSAEITEKDVIVTVGVNSFRGVCRVGSKGVVIALFVGKEEYDKIHLNCALSASAVFSGAPLETRLKLLQGIWLDRKPLAIVHSDTLLIDQQAMMEKGAEYSFEFRFFETATDRLSVLKSINFVLEDSALIFSLVDTELYQKGVAQDVLRLLFHKRQVMIGPSYAFVRAGSMFAVYSDTAAKLEALAEKISTWQNKEKLLAPSYPDKLKVSFNPYLIKSHSVVLPSASYLKEHYGLCSEEEC